MRSLHQHWPLGLSRRTALPYALAIAGLLALLLLIDAWASRAAIAWPGPVRTFFLWITDYGLSDWILIPTLAIALGALLWRWAGRIRSARRLAGEVAAIAGFIFLAVGLPGLTANLIKRAVGRGRPELFDSVGPFHFRHLFNDYTFQSFPSGHATTAVAFAFALGFLWPRLFLPFLAIGLVVAFSRVPTGMHYPSDVLGGVVVGMLGAYAVRNGFAARGLLFEHRPQGIIRRPSPLARWLSRRWRRATAGSRSG